MEKLTPFSLKGFLNRALFANKNGCFASSFVLSGARILISLEKGKVVFQKVPLRNLVLTGLGQFLHSQDSESCDSNRAIPRSLLCPSFPCISFFEFPVFSPARTSLVFLSDFLFFSCLRKKAHKHKLLALVNVQMALGQTASCPRVNRAEKFMCSPRNTGNINFSLWLTGGLSQGCPDFQKFMCSQFMCLSLALP